MYFESPQAFLYSHIRLIQKGFYRIEEYIEISNKSFTVLSAGNNSLFSHSPTYCAAFAKLHFLPVP